MRQITTRLLALLLLLTTGVAFGADWGDFTAKFVFDGAPPAPAPIVPDKDKEFCGKHDLVDESLVVNAGNKGIANVVVYLFLAKTDKKPEVHPSYAATEKTDVVLDNVNCRFEPRIVTLRTTQTLVVGNKDPLGHNTNVTTFLNAPQNVLIPSGTQYKLNFPSVESLPSPIACNVHPWMKAHVVIKENPYMAVSDKDGKVVIKNIPTGNWTFQFWHERSGFVAEGVQNGKPTKWERGRMKLDIKTGANDLGEIKLSRSVFEKK